MKSSWHMTLFCDFCDMTLHNAVVTKYDILWHAAMTSWERHGTWRHWLLQCMTIYDILWHDTAVRKYDTLWHIVTQHDTIWYSMTYCDTAWHPVTSCDMTLVSYSVTLWHESLWLSVTWQEALTISDRVSQSFLKKHLGFFIWKYFHYSKNRKYVNHWSHYFICENSPSLLGKFMTLRKWLFQSLFRGIFLQMNYVPTILQSDLRSPASTKCYSLI